MDFSCVVSLGLLILILGSRHFRYRYISQYSGIYLLCVGVVFEMENDGVISSDAFFKVVNNVP